MYTKLIIVGNLTADPTLRYTPSGVAVASFTVAVNKTWVDASGERKEKVTFYRCSAWRKLAETIAQYMTKGQRVLVEAEDIEARSYTNKNGEQVASLEVTANLVKFMTAKGDTAAATSGATAMAEGAGGPVDENDIPF